MFAELSELLVRLPNHLRRLWRPDLGTQVLFVKGKPIRIPKAGETASPYFHDHTYHPRLTPETVKAVGVNGWNWADQVSEYCTYDLDSIANHGDGLTDERLAEIVGKLMEAPEVEIVRSKSGRGIHVRVFFNPLPHAITHTEHARNGARALAWLCKRRASHWNRPWMPALKSRGFIIRTWPPMDSSY